MSRAEVKVLRLVDLDQGARWLVEEVAAKRRAASGSENFRVASEGDVDTVENLASFGIGKREVASLAQPRKRLRRKLDAVLKT